MLSDTAGSYWSTRGGTTPRQARRNAEKLVPDVAILIRVNCRSGLFSQDTWAGFLSAKALGSPPRREAVLCSDVAAS